MNTDINTNTRLFDLVRYMRFELHEAELITDEEYAWICAEAPMAKGQGSPSPRRLEDYDEIRAAARKLSDAYLRIREKLDAFDTPRAPTAEQVWEHTEAKLDELISERETLREDLKTAIQWIDDGVDQEGQDLIVRPMMAKHFEIA